MLHLVARVLGFAQGCHDRMRWVIALSARQRLATVSAADGARYCERDHALVAAEDNLLGKGEVLDRDTAADDVGPLRVHVALDLGEILGAEEDPGGRRRLVVAGAAGGQAMSAIERKVALEAGCDLLHLRRDAVASYGLDACATSSSASQPRSHSSSGSE
jgi:hypothetical protein